MLHTKLLRWLRIPLLLTLMCGCFFWVAPVVLASPIRSPRDLNYNFVTTINTTPEVALGALPIEATLFGKSGNDSVFTANDDASIIRCKSTRTTSGGKPVVGNSGIYVGTVGATYTQSAYPVAAIPPLAANSRSLRLLLPSPSINRSVICMRV